MSFRLISEFVNLDVVSIIKYCKESAGRVDYVRINVTLGGDPSRRMLLRIFKNKGERSFAHSHLIITAH